MLSRFKQLRQSSSFGAVTTPVSSVAADVSPTETYLDAILVHLSDLPPPLRREEIRRELGQHLQSLIAAHEELGETHDDAVAAALKRFGDSQQIARELMPDTKVRFPRAAFLHGLRWFGAAAVATLGCLYLFALVIAIMGLHLSSGAGGALSWAYIALCGIGVPLVGGWRIGKRAKSRAWLGVFYALAALALASLPATVGVIALDRTAKEAISPFEALQLLAILFPLFCVWMPTACISASIAQAVHNWRNRTKWGRIAR